MILNEADDIYLGSDPVEAVYLGSEKIWSRSHSHAVTGTIPLTFTSPAAQAPGWELSGPLSAGTHTLRCRRPRTDGNLITLPCKGFWSRASNGDWTNAQWTLKCPCTSNGVEFMEAAGDGSIAVNISTIAPDRTWHLVIQGTVSHDSATDTWTWFDPEQDTLFPAGTYTVSTLPEELYPSGVNRPGWVLSVAAFTANGTQVIDWQEGYDSWSINYKGRYTFTINEPCYITIYLFCSHYPNNVFSAPCGIWPRLERASAPSAFDRETFQNDCENDGITTVTIPADIPAGGSISGGTLATRTGDNILTIETLPYARNGVTVEVQEVTSS